MEIRAGTLSPYHEVGGVNPSNDFQVAAGRRWPNVPISQQSPRGQAMCRTALKTTLSVQLLQHRDILCPLVAQFDPELGVGDHAFFD